MPVRSRHTHSARRLWLRILGVAALCLLGGVTSAQAQLGLVVSPGRLSKAHATLEGATNCQKCHTAGRKVMADQCLSCHKPVAERMQAKKGVHREVSGECSTCHVEHKGPDHDVRPFDLKKFDHARDTGFALEGRHAALVTACAKCHKDRSFFTLAPSCATCHKDVHSGTLGPDCANCHIMTAAFKDAKTRFDHAKAAFALTGAHERVSCEKCHVSRVYRGIKFADCTDCHKSPHRQPSFTDCRSCHTPETWKNQKLDHGKTGFTLKGKHAELACVKCHTKPATQQPLLFDRCARCHQDPHKATFKDDCGACHTESTFARAKFDHAKNTRFPLTGLHQPLVCAKCHKGASAGPAKTLDFRGLSTACASCHADVHKGELGQTCEKCHTAAAFRLPNYVHTRDSGFFGGRHQGVPCASCHVSQSPAAPRRPTAPVASWTFKALATACATCHRDPHLGQVGTACQTCHKIDAVSFAAITFAHDQASYQLTGRHVSVECRKCHKPETGAFPAGHGTAVRLKGLSTTCAACHTDQHLGQLGNTCTTCHTTATFKLPTYAHAKPAADLMPGKHATLKCVECHKPLEAQYPAGRGTTVRYKVGLGCVNCHTDQHGGSLGSSCVKCHKTTAESFKAAAFTHTAIFPLVGVHATQSCAVCHVKNVYKGTPNTCFGCHKTSYDRTTTPNHRAGGFPTTCDTCHSPGVPGWKATFNHAATFPLVGVHASQACAACHVNNVYRGTPNTCYGCHKSRYDRTTSPNHAAATFATACDSCHKPSDASWTAYVFTHPATFPLVGLHATQPCAACHGSGVYRGTANTCVGCHKPLYDRAATPNHAAAGFPTTCDTCHKPTNSSWTATVDHAAAYPLVGVHTTQPCAACHVNNLYRGTPTACFGCHKSNYDRTTNPNHAAATFATACDSCHKPTDASWTAFVFTHPATFQLVGLHATQPCQACHVNKVYKGTPNTCVGCHKSTYDRTTSPSHTAAGFPTTCDTCHNASAPTWTATFNHGATYPLVGVHATQPCASCHVNNLYRGTSRTCVGCHKAFYDRTTNPNHAAAGFSTACDSCHSASAANWTASFNHNQYFVLAGRHLSAACTDCHKNNVYKGTSRTCFPCHQSDFNNSRVPNHVTAGFPSTCDTCHKFADGSWNQATFSHSGTFPLVGVHASQACAACHVGGVYKGTPNTCFGCHKSNYDRSTNPNHAAAGFSTTCDSCHKSTDASWTAFVFTHPVTFRLVGLHATQPCSACHTNNVYKGTPNTCVGCHLASYNRTTSPSHTSAGFPTTCDTCHNASAPNWTANFNHSSTFPLVGVHATQACAACHIGGVYKGTPNTCFGCHKTSYDRTTNPNHAAAGFSTTCDSCHKPTDASWTAFVFTHPVTFRLVGLHATQPCAACHTGNVYKGTPNTCFGCHKSNYDRTTTPNHSAAGFSTQCDICHSASAAAWTSSFNHSQYFVLAGRHLTATCTDCHKNNVYPGTPTTCFACHQASYAATASPNHAAAGFSTTCDSCHKSTDASWTAFVFTHPVTFRLVGLHATQPCAACHANNVYKGTPNTCVGCHLASYNRTTSPSHTAAGFPTTCDTCHNASSPSWTANFNHNTTFPLVGLHATQPCAACHVNNLYKGTPNTCFGCHKTSYDRTTNPNHAAAGFSTTCDSCHKPTDASWTAFVFTHPATFRLVGLHATQPCQACHVNNVYKGTPSTCVGCHLATYNRTTTPSHVAAGFPTTCDTCHNASSATWTANFNHNSTYPLVGLHATQACAACHVNNVYKGTPNTCLGCHLTNYNRTTTPNHAAAGFSTTCDTCHKPTDASWTAFVFTHPVTFPLVGLHATQPCAVCHVNNLYKGTPNTCFGCHKTNYDRTTTPNHAAAGFSTQCDICHSASGAAWTSSFNHSQYFVLAGRHLTAACTDCHKNNVYKGTPATCFACHQTSYTATTTPNHAAAGFSTACDTCHKFTDASWTAFVFVHPPTFQLVGLHATQPCAACHVNNLYKGTPNTCVGCHLANYNKTTNPNHVAAGFPTTCDSCHKSSDASWTRAVFNHTYFPIASGRHAGNQCSACHNNPSSYKVFTCLTCHVKATIDSKHQGRAGYRYDSAACYSCHPNGSAG